MPITHLPRALSDDFKEIIKEAQENCKKRKAADDTITCPFLDLPVPYAMRGWELIFQRCASATSHGGSEHNHPCDVLTYEQVRLIFWREVPA